MQKKYQIPFVSSNVKFADSEKHFLKPFLIKEKNINGQKIKLGFLGVTMATNNLVPIVDDEPILIATDPIVAAQETVEALKKNCDVIIALSHLGFSDSKNLAKKVPEIDIIISGHGYSVRTSPLKINSTSIVQGKNKGQNLNLLTVQFNSKNEIDSQIGRVIILNENFNNDSEFNKLISEYRDARRVVLTEMRAKHNKPKSPAP